MVATPAKCAGRKRSSKPTAAGLAKLIVVAKPSPYMASPLGAKIKSPSAVANRAASASKERG